MTLTFFNFKAIIPDIIVLRNIWHFHGLFNKGHHTISKRLPLSYPMVPVLIILFIISDLHLPPTESQHGVLFIKSYWHQLSTPIWNENENLDWHRRKPIYPWHSFTFIGRKISETHCAFPRERRLVGSDSKNDLESEMHMWGVQEIRQSFIPLLSFHPNPLHFFPLYFLSPFSFFPLYPSPSCFPFPSLFPQYHQKFSGAKWATGSRAFEMVLECSTVATGEQRVKSKELFSSTEKGRGLTFFSTCLGPAFKSVYKYSACIMWKVEVCWCDKGRENRDLVILRRWGKGEGSARERLWILKLLCITGFDIWV